MTTPQHNLAVIKVVGIGGGGTNAIKRMIGEGMTCLLYTSDAADKA